MVRGRRVMVEGGLYHVYNRFARGEGVFSDPAEAVEFAELLREVKERDGLAILAWAILSNHYHIAVRILGLATCFRGRAEPVAPDGRAGTVDDD